MKTTVAITPQIIQFLERIPNAFFILDQNLNFVYIHRYAQKFISKKIHALIGKNIITEIPDFKNTEFYEKYREALQQKRSIAFASYYAPHKRWYGVQAFPFQQGLLVNLSDITGRKQTEETLKIRLQQQAAVAELGHKALQGIGLEELMHESVAYLAQVLDVEYTKVLELMPDRKRLILRAGIGWRKDILVNKTTVDAGKLSQAGYTLICRRPVIVKDLPNEKRFTGPSLLINHDIKSGMSTVIYGKGKPFGVLGVHTKRHRNFSHDDLNFLQAIAAILSFAIIRKQTEEEVHFIVEASTILSSSLNYETTLTNLSNLIVPYLADFCVIDLIEEDGSYNRVVINHKDPKLREYFQQLDKFPPHPKTAHPLLEVTKKGESRMIPRIPQNFLRNITANNEHYRILQKLKPTSFLAVPLKVWDRTMGAITLVAVEHSRTYNKKDLVLAEDLARRAAVAVDNARLYQSAQKAIEMRDEFLSIASHELRTPLTSIKAFIQILCRQFENKKQSSTYRYLEKTQQHIDRLTGLINDLLDVTRIQAGKLMLHKTEFDIDNLMTEVIEDNQAITTTHTILKKNTIHQKISADRNRLHQVLENLLMNAIKYSPQSNKVIVKTEVKRRNVIVSIQDFGLGIPKHQLSRVFERFFRGQGQTSDQFLSGVGLGLYISSEIIKRHKGQIGVESKVGKGSTFYFSLPLI